MIELPRACIRADEIAEYADFFSFGTNDLTQTALGLSRDDAEGKFLSRYLEDGVLERNPFETLDQSGVGDLMRIAVERGPRREARPQARDLRRARRRAGVGRVLPRPRPRLRQLLALPRAARAPRGGPGGAEGRRASRPLSWAGRRVLYSPRWVPRTGRRYEVRASGARCSAWECVRARRVRRRRRRARPEGELNEDAAAACDGSALTEAPKLPASFPQVENATYTQQSTQGPTDVVEGYFEGSVEGRPRRVQEGAPGCRASTCSSTSSRTTTRRSRGKARAEAARSPSARSAGATRRSSSTSRTAPRASCGAENLGA